MQTDIILRNEEGQLSFIGVAKSFNDSQRFKDTNTSQHENKVIGFRSEIKNPTDAIIHFLLSDGEKVKGLCSPYVVANLFQKILSDSPRIIDSGHTYLGVDEGVLVVRNGIIDIELDELGKEALLNNVQLPTFAKLEVGHTILRDGKLLSVAGKSKNNKEVVLFDTYTDELEVGEWSKLKQNGILVDLNYLAGAQDVKGKFLDSFYDELDKIFPHTMNSMDNRPLAKLVNTKAALLSMDTCHKLYTTGFYKTVQDMSELRPHLSATALEIINA